MFEMGSPEQLAFIDNVSDAIAGKAKIKQLEREMDALDSCMATMAAQKKRIQELEKMVALLKERSVDYAVAGISTADALDHAVNLLEKKLGRPITHEFKVIRTRRYNEQIDELLKTGELKVDPRQTRAMNCRNWYIPELSR